MSKIRVVFFLIFSVILPVVTYCLHQVAVWDRTQSAESRHSDVCSHGVKSVLNPAR